MRELFSFNLGGRIVSTKFVFRVWPSIKRMSPLANNPFIKSSKEGNLNDYLRIV